MREGGREEAGRREAGREVCKFEIERQGRR